LTITIPVKPHLKKFLLKRYNGHPCLSMTDEFSAVLIQIIEGKRFLKPYEYENRKYTDSITFSIPAWYSSLNMITLKPSHLILFNQFVDGAFRERIFDSVMIELANSPREYNVIKPVIKRFMVYYDINEDELAYDSLMKYFYRWRKERNKKIFYKHVPLFNEVEKRA